MLYLCSFYSRENFHSPMRLAVCNGDWLAWASRAAPDLISQTFLITFVTLFSLLLRFRDSQSSRNQIRPLRRTIISQPTNCMGGRQNVAAMIFLQKYWLDLLTTSSLLLIMRRKNSWQVCLSQSLHIHWTDWAGRNWNGAIVAVKAEAPHSEQLH